MAEIDSDGLPRVLVADRIDEEGLEILRRDCRVDVPNGLDAAGLAEQIPAYDAVIVRSRTRMTRDLIEAGRRLRVIGRAGIGVDNIDVEAATRKGILVLNTPTSSTATTAEHTLAMLLALARNVVPASVSVKKGEWRREAFTGVDLHDKTLGVVGLGKIGTEVARQALSFRMKILAFDPMVTAEHAAKIGAERVGLDELLSRSDFITLHLPLTKETRHLIGERQVGLLKKGVRIVNCARGGLIDEKALLRALEEGRVAGAALDVFEEEPIRDLSLVSHPAVIATPHIGASTHEAQKMVSLDIAEQVRVALHGGSALGAVNLPFLAPEVLKQIQPYLGLGERIGELLAQFGPVSVRRVEIMYAGEIAGLPTHPITASVVMGLLRDVVEDPVTLVNAALVARQRAIELVESRCETSAHYHSLVAAQAFGEGGSRAVTGTVVGTGEARIVKVDSYSVGFRPVGTLLATLHEDRPGVVARVTALLAEAAINISEIQLGRDREGGSALMALGMDAPPPEGILERIRAVPGMTQARLVNFGG